MTSIWDRANPQLRDLSVYQPGKPIEETACELAVDPGDIIKLASNENPLGPSPKALVAMRDGLQSAQLYPDGGGFYLREALARKLDVTPENLILGNGSNEIIEFLAHAFLNRGDDVIASEHAFIAYKLIASLFGARTIEPASPEYRHDLDAVLIGDPELRVVHGIQAGREGRDLLGEEGQRQATRAQTLQRGNHRLAGGTARLDEYDQALW